VRWEQSVDTYLDELVPARGDDDGVLGVRREANARNPLGVALLGDGELAVTEGVPQLDAPVARAGNDLAVVGGERDGEDIVGVANETAGGGASGELPKAESLVPRGRESVGAVRRDHLPSQSAKPILRLPRWVQFRRKNIRSQRRCGSGRGATAWGSRTGSHRG